MAIIFDENNRLITLNTKNSTYQMKIDEYGFLLHLYYGKRTNGNFQEIHMMPVTIENIHLMHFYRNFHAEEQEILEVRCLR